MHMFASPYDLVGRYNIEPKVLLHWIEDIRRGYNQYSNDYHNWRHAIGVAQFVYHAMVSEGGTYLNFQDILVVYTAALAHDVAHPGKNSDFLIRTWDPLAITYNDRSPLENMHACTAWEALRKFDFLAEASSETFSREAFRAKLVSAILATDMSSHVAFTDRFTSRMKNKDENPLITDTKADKDKQDRSKSDRRMLLEAFIKAGDLSANAQHFKFQLLCVRDLEEESFKQGDAERSLGMPVSPLFDRQKDSFASTQEFFLGRIVRGLFE